MINKQTCSDLPTFPTLFVTEATSMVLKMPSPTNSAVFYGIYVFFWYIFHRSTPYFINFCRKRRLPAFNKVRQKKLRPKCSKQGGGVGGVQQLFKQLSEKLVADGIPYHDNDYGSDVALGSRKMALIMTMRVR